MDRVVVSLPIQETCGDTVIQKSPEWISAQEQVVASNEVLPDPFVSAEALKACALIGLHSLAADYEVGSSGSQSLDLGDMWRYGYPKSPDRDGNVESWTESEGTSSSRKCEHNVESLALNVMGQDQSGEKISLFLEDGELARVALSCHIALNMLCQEMHQAWWPFHSARRKKERK